MTSHLARLGHRSETVGELFDNGVLMGRELRRRSICGAPNAMPCGRQSVGGVDDGHRVKQGLGRDASDVQAHAAERRPLIDEDRRDTEVAGAEGRRVAAWARA